MQDASVPLKAQQPVERVFHLVVSGLYCRCVELIIYEIKNATSKRQRSEYKSTGVRHGGTGDRAVHRREATEGAIDARVGVVDVGRLLIAHPAELQ